MKLGPQPDSALRQWGFEIYCMIMAIGMLVAMGTVLFIFDTKSAFDGRIITLNAIISTLSTGNRAPLLAMLASAISQWNWLLFSEKRRRLLDFEHLAEASRGPLGSLKILLSPHFVGGWVVRGGALVTILTIALDPFAQLLVQIQEKPKSFEPEDRSRASVQVAYSYSREGDGYLTTWENVTVNGDELSGPSRTHPIPDYAMEVAVLTSFAESESGISLQPGFNCTSGNCEFEPYESLSVCSRCVDISSSLERRTKVAESQPLKYGAGTPQDKELFNSTEYYLPNGLYLINADEDGEENNWIADKMLMTMFGTGDRNKTVNMQGVDTLLWDQSFIKVDREFEDNTKEIWPGPEVSAYECELHYCVKEFTASIKDGRLRETSKEVKKYKRNPSSWQMDYKEQQEMSEFADLPEWTEDYLAFHPVLSAFARSPLQLGPPPTYEPYFYIEAGSVWGSSILLKNLFTTCIDKNDNCTEENRDASFGPPNGFFAHEWTGRHKPDFAKDFWEARDLDSVFTKIADSMTTALRNGADRAWWSKTNDTNDPNGYLGPSAAIGKVTEPVAIYNVVWPWIALHCVSTLLGLVFLALTIRFTSKAGLPAWKSSELAIFAQASGMERIFDGDERQHELEQKAKEASVLLLGGKGSEEHDSEMTAEETSTTSSRLVPAESQGLVLRSQSM